MSNERIVLVDLEMCDQVEYRGYCVTRIHPQTYLFAITPVSGEASTPTGTWTSAKDAIAAIDELLGKEGRVRN